MGDEETHRHWLELCNRVADPMKVHTRPFVAAMAGREIGTGTFVGADPVGVVTCAHVVKVEPCAHHVDHTGSIQIRQGHLVHRARRGGRRRLRIRAGRGMEQGGGPRPPAPDG